MMRLPHHQAVVMVVAWSRFGYGLVGLVRLKVDVIVTGGTPATIAAKHATTTIPIVFRAKSIVESIDKSRMRQLKS